MRKGLTLIELILSMVIIGVVFTVIPRLIISMNQSEKATINEETMFNALTYIGKIIYLPWDQNNTESDGILVTSGLADYSCSDGYRSGNFIGGRRCDDLNRTASAIGHDTTSVLDYNDIDDYDQNTTTPEINCNGTSKPIGKEIGAAVSYTPDPAVINPAISHAFELNASSSSGTTNTKYIEVRIGDCTVLRYHSFNIGRTGFEYRTWE